MALLLSLGTLLDWVALGTFVACFVTYDLTMRLSPQFGRPTLRTAMHAWRIRWMSSLTERENRIMDAQLLGHIIQSMTFLASTSVLVLAGLAAAFGTSQTAASMISDLPFTYVMTPNQFAFRLLLPSCLMVYAFFVFTTGLRQFNYACVMVGALPTKFNPDEKTYFVEDAAQVLGLGTNNFNAGVRSFYFALASLSWFFHPVAFIIASISVTILLYRRQTSSDILRAVLKHPGLT